MFCGSGDCAAVRVALAIMCIVLPLDFVLAFHVVALVLVVFAIVVDRGRVSVLHGLCTT